MATRISVGFYQSGPVPQLHELAQLVENLGFDGLWLNDAQCRWRDVYVSLAAVAVSTSRIEMGPSVTNPLTRHLSVTASAMYSLHELSRGRARMGIGIGDAAAKDIGIRPTTTAHLEGAVNIIRELWAGHEVFFDGVSSRLWYATSAPRSIPVYFAGSGPRLFKSAGQIADGILLNVGADPKYIQSALAIVEDGLRSVGRNRSDIRIAVRIPACVSDDPDARRYVRSRVGLVVLRRVPADLEEKDLVAVEKIRRAYDPQEHLRLDAAYAEYVTDSLVDKFSLAGRPEECLERVRALMTTGIDELNLTFMHPNTEDLLRIFAERILQKL